MDINERCQKLPVIKSQKSPWEGGLQPDGTIQFPYPVYPKSVHEWIESLYNLDLADSDYEENMKRIREKNIEDLIYN